VRARDGATNASPVLSLTLTVIQAVNDTRAAFNANTSVTQTSDSNTAATSVLANDQPIGLAGRTVKLASAPVRIAGSGTGTIAVTCPFCGFDRCDACNRRQHRLHERDCTA